MLFLIILIVVIICVIRIRNYSSKKINNDSKVKANFKLPFGNVTISNKEDDVSSDKLPDFTHDEREKMIKGDVKIITNVNKKVTKYVNGEKVSVEETNSIDNVSKKSINKCPNCGASIDLSQEECSYCGTKIN